MSKQPRQSRATTSAAPRLTAAQHKDIRATWEQWRESHYERLMEHCKDQLLQRGKWELFQQRGYDSLTWLYSSPGHVLQHWLSEEATEFLELNPRITWAEWKATQLQELRQAADPVEQNSAAIYDSLESLESWGTINRELAAHIVRARASYSWAALEELTGMTRKALNLRVVSAYGRLISFEELLALEAAEDLPATDPAA